MRYKEAYKRAKFCSEAIASTLVAQKGKKPKPDTESTVQCKVKARASVVPDHCYIIDGSYCPLGKD